GTFRLRPAPPICQQRQGLFVASLPRNFAPDRGVLNAPRCTCDCCFISYLFRVAPAAFAGKSCASLESFKLESTTMTSAHLIAAGAFVPPPQTDTKEAEERNR